MAAGEWQCDNCSRWNRSQDWQCACGRPAPAGYAPEVTRCPS